MFFVVPATVAAGISLVAVAFPITTLGIFGFGNAGIAAGM